MENGPVPFAGPVSPPTLFLAIGEGPGAEESKKGVPFVGKSGKLLRSLITKVGLDLDSVMFANVVSCWPRTEGQKTDTRIPTDKEAKACRGNLEAQVRLANTPYILLVGGTALKAVRPDIKVSKQHGLVFLWQRPEGSYWVMPILHPAAILRQRTLKDTTIRDLEVWSRIVLGEIQPPHPESCIICGDFIRHIDPDNVGYCDDHWMRYGNNWKKAREFWMVKEKKDNGQATLL